MSILVTGGAGYIGSHTVVELLKLGKEVVIVDNLSNSNIVVFDRIEEITGKRPTFYQLDVVDKDGLRTVFEKEAIESAIHFAGYKAVGESVEKPIMYYENNIMSTLSLVEVMAEFGVKKIVFSSSATVYGLNNPSPLVEYMPTSATNPYGYTKVMLEQILRDVEIADSKWSVALLRYFNPIGAHESGLIGEDPAGIPNNLMPFIAQVAVGKREQLNVFGNDYDTVDGTGVRDYIHVVDLALGHIKALEKISSATGVHTYNLGSGQGTSVLELVQAFEKVNGVPVPYRIVDRRPGDVATCYANADKALRELDWKTEKTIEDMCRDTWNWQSKNPSGYEG
ncbi:UDP-glucose 4-epimerase GalE [Streptococcus ruminantium]|uniref:UDP-glucose 4-epimerase n=1 Tax=Streptococcus ruminantium TaxID=1917441 RepID=A0ABU1B4U4_9STRE|nr:UDP-glucose 4-epimerase GalE [Streptococcus ruminantium]MDQ8758712.1 UDP-glucose 4-epimerase GalE [Streptococcus ruminantium]MDQ8768564.1 UDP-glucose 4-epimerase GalE [Streptococcus ruminantium]MDQ8774900.1 UDP-glucose 4-epimerase GalE [Streptococcus ruminantium]MDQ8794181.1 UDP-glucose 4-epimerase GalE [Streptococcus ruminantium]MDQ8796104.1 UDP-glucose 4-epimerase GalE [Streptococcus ruminantium]